MTRFLYRLPALALCTVLVLTSVSAAYAQTPVPGGTPQIHITQVDNSHFPQVTVYVSVTDPSGAPLGVDPSTIQISENGQVMQTQVAGAPGSGSNTKGLGQLTSLLVMDVSGSMATNNKLDGAKAAAKAYVDQMRPGDQAGVVSFNTSVNVVQAVTSDHQALKNAIDSLQANGNTAMFDALLKAEQLLGGASGRKAILVVTDGMDNRSKANEDAVVQGIGQGGLTISTIGFGNPQEIGTLNGINEAELKSLASRAGGTYSFAPSPAQLASVFQQYGTALQSEYALTYTSPFALRDGVNRNLSVSLSGGAATASSKYNPGGVLPEVASQSWMLFAGIFVILLLLLAVPFVLSRGLGGLSFGGRKKASGRVKLTGASSTAASSTASTPPASRGHVRIK